MTKQRSIALTALTAAIVAMSSAGAWNITIWLTGISDLLSTATWTVTTAATLLGGALVGLTIAVKNLHRE